MVYIYWVFPVSVYSVTLCLYVICVHVLYNDVQILVQVNNKVSVLFCSSKARFYSDTTFVIRLQNIFGFYSVSHLLKLSFSY